MKGKGLREFLFKNNLAPPVMNELDYYVQILIMDFDSTQECPFIDLLLRTKSSKLSQMLHYC